MKVTEGKIGRVFVLRFDDGDVVPECIEKFAADAGIAAAHVSFSGGLTGGEIAAGTDSPYAVPFHPCAVKVAESRSAAFTGILAIDAVGTPHLTLAGALGYKDGTFAGNIGAGAKVWLSAEAVVYEIVSADCRRELDESTGRLELAVNAAAPARRIAEPKESTVVHSGDHTHILFAFNAELN